MFEVLTALRVKTTVFWNVILCDQYVGFSEVLVCTYQTSGHDVTEGCNIDSVKTDKVYSEWVGLELQGKIYKARPCPV